MVLQFNARLIFRMLDTMRVFLYFSRPDIMWRHSSAGRAVES